MILGYSCQLSHVPEDAYTKLSLRYSKVAELKNRPEVSEVTTSMQDGANSR